MFWAPCGSGAGGVDVWGWGCPTRTHMQACTCTHGKHDNFMQMAAPIGGIPGNSLWCHMHVRVCACAHVWGAPSHHPPGGHPRNQSKFYSTWTNQDISIPFEDLKSVETSPPMGGCMVWWVGGWVVGWWVGSGQNTKNLKIVDWIKIIQFCLKIYHLLRHPHPWVGGWVGQWVGSSQMTNNWVNLDLIEIIQFCLKIYDM